MSRTLIRSMTLRYGCAKSKICGSVVDSGGKFISGIVKRYACVSLLRTAALRSLPARFSRNFASEVLIRDFPGMVSGQVLGAGIVETSKCVC